MSPKRRVLSCTGQTPRALRCQSSRALVPGVREETAPDYSGRTQLRPELQPGKCLFSSTRARWPRTLIFSKNALVTVKGYGMIDENIARLRTYRNNIRRYRRLLKTTLTDLEREFLERRLAEEQLAFEALVSGSFPMPIHPEHPA